MPKLVISAKWQHEWNQGLSLTAWFHVFAVSVKDFSAMDKGYVTQTKTYHSNWVCFYGTMVALAADFP